VANDANAFRRKRFGLFLSLVDKLGAKKPVRILDVGGTISYWEGMRALWQDRDFDITLVNVGVESSDEGVYHLRDGNACAMPEYADNSFDIVHSNSVIEHVGHWPQMRAMADEVRRLAPHYYLQTPNFWFPVEPHFKAAFLHWFPESARAGRLLNKKRGNRLSQDFHEAMFNVQDINLLTARQLGALFPDAAIKRERIGPLTKSIIAIR
jgi:hypothetical protein